MMPHLGPEPLTQRPVPDVAIVASSFYPNVGGVEELVRQLARRQRDQGARPLVVTMRWPKSLPAGETMDGVPVRRFVFRTPERSPRQFVGSLVTRSSVARRMTKAISDHGAQVVHVQCVSGNGWYARQSARALGLPLVVTLQGELTMDATGVYQRSRVLPGLLRELLRTADAVTACSGATLREAEEFAAVELGERGHVVYNGVSLGDFDRPPPPPAPRPYAVAIGRHVPQKGFDVLLRAFATAAGTPDFDLDLVLAGDGPERPRLEVLARDLGIAGRVNFPGSIPRPDVPELFLASSFFVLPSRHEPMGIVNVEAMAAGKAVVASDVGGVAEVVEDGITGLLVPPDEPEPLARALVELATDRGLAKRLGEAGRGRAAAFDWEIVAGEYESVYAEAAERMAQRRSGDGRNRTRAASDRGE